MLTLALALMLISGDAAPANDDVTEVLDALNAAIEEARWNLEFYCTYLYSNAVGKARDDARAKLGKGSTVEGVMARRGRLFRVSGRAVLPGNWPENFECIDSPQVQLHWYLPPAAKYGLEREPITIMRSPNADPSQRGQLYSCAMTHLDPLFYGGWKDGKVLQRYTSEDLVGKRLAERVERPDAAHLVILTEVYQGEKLESRERATFSTKYKPAVLVRLESFLDQRHISGRPPAEFVLEASGFVQVTGGWLASRMTTISGPVQVKDSADAHWLASEWVSDDLGKRPPTAEDFVITIPEHVEVRGLKSEAPVGTVRRLDMNTLTLEQVETLGGIDVGHRPPPAQAAGSRPPRLLLVVGGIILRAGVGALIWRARLRRRGP